MTLEGIVCPACGAQVPGARKMLGEEPKPAKGHFAVCGGCAALLQFGEEGRLVLVGQLPADMSPPERIAMLLLWARSAQGDMSAGYEFGITLIRRAVRRWLAEFPDDPPRFALGPNGIAIIASVTLEGLGKVIARNEAARLVLDAALGFCKAAGAQDPTLIMLKIALELEEIPTEDISLAELGLIPKDAPN